MFRLNFLEKRCVLFTALLLMTMASSLPAATVIYTGGQIGSIDGLIVDGSEYNVTFNAYAPDYTFLNNESGANDAVDAINAILNGSPAQMGVYFISDPPYGSQFFEVSYAIAAANQKDVILGNLTTQWINQGPLESDPNDNFDNNYAHFTPVPEPSCWALLALGLFPFTPKIRRRLGGTRLTKRG